MFHQCLQHGTDKKHWSPALVISWHNLMLVSYTGLWSSYTRAEVLLLSDHLNKATFRKTIGPINTPTKKKEKATYLKIRRKHCRIAKGCPEYMSSVVKESNCSYQNNCIKQCSDVWALSRLKPTFLRNDPFELIFHSRLSKTNSSSHFVIKSLRNFFFRRNLNFCGSNFHWPLWNWGFETNMESNTSVTLNFEDLAVNNYLFFICVHLLLNNVNVM